VSAPRGKDLIDVVATTSDLLEAIADDYEVLADLPFELRQRFAIAAGRVARPGPWAKRALTQEAKRRREAERKARDTAKLEATGIRQSRRAGVFTPWQHGAITDQRGGRGTKPNLLAEVSQNPKALPESDTEPLSEPIHCYICKAKFTRLHFFYDALCPDCAALNWEKRSPEGDLRGRVALITGARVKIGFYAALMLLRAGARVLVATRFPHDAAARYASETDFEDWADRLEVFGLDLRHTPSVEAFAGFLGRHLHRLDFIINNACQTVRRPAGFYDHLLEAEASPLDGAGRQLLGAFEAMRDATGDLHEAAAMSQVPLLGDDLGRDFALFPAGQLDADGQQVDRREVNSWRLGLADVSAVELLEVQLVNAVAPFILNARLKPVMLRHDDRDRHIVNVSAMEGQFSRRLKTDRHPHTNMAKAALNMMTRTSAADYVRDGIHMNSVDTGWVTDEDPIALAERKTRDHGFQPPLDVVDGAARIVDPIFTGIRSGKHMWGAFLKDYHPTDW